MFGVTTLDSGEWLLIMVLGAPADGGHGVLEARHSPIGHSE